MIRREELVAILLWGAAIPIEAQVDPAKSDSGYVAGDYRVFTGTGEPSSIDDILADMARSQVVFIGEAHDDPTGHMLERLLLERAHEMTGRPAPTREPGGEDRPGRSPVALSLEFFQRDVQPILDEYLAGLISEAMFVTDSRPWPRYATDYRPLIEYAREHGIDVIAANAPRRYARRVSELGRESLEALTPAARAVLPPLPYGQPSPAYRDQWIGIISEVMQQEGLKCGRPIPEAEAGGPAAHAPAPVGAHDNMGNQLHSQVLWDASMGYWIADYLEREPDALVLHMVGSFHVERGTGTPEHLEAYRPGTRTLIIIIRPTEDVDAFEPAPEGQWGDFVIQTDISRTLEQIECRAYLARLESG